MTETLQTNVFFFITSLAVIVVTMLFVVVLWYVIAILREVRKIATRVGNASEGLERDIAYVRAEVRSGVDRAATFLGGLSTFFVGREVQPKKRSRRKKEETDTQEPVY